MPEVMPRAPLPPPLRGLEAGTFAHFTVTQRLPNIIRRVLSENTLPPGGAQNLEVLAAGLPYSPLRLLRDETAPDAPAWQAYTAPYIGQNWLSPPWFFIETYFFRRILEATGFFEPGPGRGLDPYAVQKWRGLSAARPLIARLANQVEGWQAALFEQSDLAQLLVADVWSNQADLSMFPGGHSGLEENAARPASEQLIVNDAGQIAAALFTRQGLPSRVDFVLDNTGIELVYDLALAEMLLSNDLAETVQFHVKIHPTYVSDVTLQDVESTLAYLEGSPEPAAVKLAGRLRARLESGRLRLRTHWFWTSPCALWEMPGDLRAELESAQLVISKGDANYRRAVGDLHWPFDAPLAEILNGAPAPWALLRVLKSEVAAGLPAQRLAALSAADRDWMTNGKWGVIQFQEIPR